MRPIRCIPWAATARVSRSSTRELARHLTSGAPIEEALTAYDAERRPATSAVVMQNRRGGNEGVTTSWKRAPEGFDDLDAVASHQELQAIVVGYSRLAGFAPIKSTGGEPADPHAQG